MAELIPKLRISIANLSWSPVVTGGERKEWRIGMPRLMDCSEMFMIVAHLGLAPGRFAFKPTEKGESHNLHIYSEPANGKETIQGEA
jgi:hypothetical protein